MFVFQISSRLSQSWSFLQPAPVCTVWMSLCQHFSEAIIFCNCHICFWWCIATWFGLVVKSFVSAAGLCYPGRWKEYNTHTPNLEACRRIEEHKMFGKYDTQLTGHQWEVQKRPINISWHYRYWRQSCHRDIACSNITTNIACTKS